MSSASSKDTREAAPTVPTSRVARSRTDSTRAPTTRSACDTAARGDPIVRPQHVHTTLDLASVMRYALSTAPKLLDAQERAQQSVPSSGTRMPTAIERAAQDLNVDELLNCWKSNTFPAQSTRNLRRPPSPQLYKVLVHLRTAALTVSTHRAAEVLQA
ncbi:hypothetical protein PENSPDRAFT_691194 [Peniophora sp. CONT]|nr:hypothetical protein PENSPDRAFT_691194 [Peniophora sp. CONT]